jgi:hypothetical protein
MMVVLGLAEENARVGMFFDRDALVISGKPVVVSRELACARWLCAVPNGSPLASAATLSQIRYLKPRRIRVLHTKVLSFVDEGYSFTKIKGSVFDRVESITDAIFRPHD